MDTTPTVPVKDPVIRKAKITDKLFLHAAWDQEMPGHANKSFDLDSTVPVHQDLKDAFSKLNIHLGMMSDYIPWPKNAQDLAAIEAPTDFYCRSFSIGGSGEAEGVTLSGSKDGYLGNININTPFQRFVNTEYRFMGELSAIIQECITEVEQYIFHGKKAATMEQGTLDIPEVLDNEVTGAVKEKGKGSKGKLRAISGEKKDTKKPKTDE